MEKPNMAVQSPIPFGLSNAPHALTKVIPAALRKLGICVVIYLDDMLIMARSKEEAMAYLATALELLIALGPDSL